MESTHRPIDAPTRLSELYYRRDQIDKAIRALERVQRLRDQRAGGRLLMFPRPERLAG